MWISFEAMVQVVLHPTLQRYGAVDPKLHVGDVEPRPVLAAVVPVGWSRYDLPGSGAPAGVCLSWLPRTSGFYPSWLPRSMSMQLRAWTHFEEGLSTSPSTLVMRPLRTGKRSQYLVLAEGGHLKTDPAFGASRIIISIFACVAKSVVEALQKAL